jgi:hypothetical protein
VYLLSFAVIVAATVVQVADGVASDKVDLTAVVASTVILLWLLPPLSGPVSTFGEDKSIHAKVRDVRTSIQQMDLYSR